MHKQLIALTFFLTVALTVFSVTPPGEGADSIATAQAGADEDAGPWFRDSAATRRSSGGPIIGGQVQIDREDDSHFYVTAEINGRSIRMMVDSGASMIALTRNDAELIGIDVDRLPALGRANTAGGVVPIRPIELDRVRVESLEVADVQAAVIDADMPTSLMGQSFLSRLQEVTVEGDRMMLR
ncbi:MAG: TIGR02281 family clan AA aspartic protease [Sphingopyxis sp.]|nr:TIGR02281 family clan AA aspartic protease [Sphingopyxis sp.]